MLCKTHSHKKIAVEKFSIELLFCKFSGNVFVWVRFVEFYIMCDWTVMNDNIELYWAPHKLPFVLFHRVAMTTPRTHNFWQAFIATGSFSLSLHVQFNFQNEFVRLFICYAMFVPYSIAMLVCLYTMLTCICRKFSLRTEFKFSNGIESNTKQKNEHSPPPHLLNAFEFGDVIECITRNTDDSALFSRSLISGIYQTMMMCVSMCLMYIFRKWNPTTIHLIVWPKNFASWISFQFGVHAINRLILIKSQRFDSLTTLKNDYRMIAKTNNNNNKIPIHLVGIVNLEARFYVNFQPHLNIKLIYWFMEYVFFMLLLFRNPASWVIRINFHGISIIFNSI